MLAVHGGWPPVILDGIIALQFDPARKNMAAGVAAFRSSGPAMRIDWQISPSSLLDVLRQLVGHNTQVAGTR